MAAVITKLFCIENLIDVFISLVRRKYDDSCMRVDGADLPNRLDAVHVRQTQIHECNVRPHGVKQCHRFTR